MVKEREIEFDILRLIATIAVIATHVCGCQIHSLTVTSSDFIWLNIIRAAITWDVPIFVMISGRFFLDPEKKKSLSTLYQKSIKHLVVAFLIWSAIYTGYYMLMGWLGGGNSLSMWKEYVYEFVTGPYHLWYIFMIVGLYVASPILRKIAEEKQLMEYFIVLFLVAQFLEQYGRKLHLAGAFVTGILGKAYFHIALGYAGYFVLGYYLYKYGVSEKIKKWLYVLAPVLIVFSCLGTTLDSIRGGELNEFFSTYQTPNVIIESCGIYLLLTKKIKIQLKEKAKKIVSTLGEYGLGIYFCHALMLEILSKTGLEPTFVTPVIGVSIMTICVFLMSVFVVSLICKVPMLKKTMM